MKVLIVINSVIPAKEYGGTERVVWWLGQELVKLGHHVQYLAALGSTCPFAPVIEYDPRCFSSSLIPPDVDLVHLPFEPDEKLSKPFLVTHHGNVQVRTEFDINTVFVSRNHAQRNGGECFVYNGLDPDEYGPVDLNCNREHLLFLGYSKRPEKNLKDCSTIARKTGNVLAVVGGKDKWFKRRPWLRYKGFLGGAEKNAVLQASKALLFPVLWHEPFGLAIMESLYFGCPVFGTRYGSLPELVPADVGFLSNNLPELVDAVRGLDRYRRQRCHEYVMDQFTSRHMAQKYLTLYEKVLKGIPLNPRPPVNDGQYSPAVLLPMSR